MLKSPLTSDSKKAVVPDKPLFYLAPMLGITDASFRGAFMESFGGFDQGISPFVRTMQGQRFKASAVRDLKPQKNTALPIHPQIMTNQADDFIHLAKVLFDLGYPVINLNMGCPAPTSAGRGRGAGLLPECEYVDRLLDQVLSVIPNRLSIKTRVGFSAEDDLLKMTKVFNRYPLHEVIIHPRTATQKYQGEVNHRAFEKVCETLDHDVVYSGDILTPDDYQRLQLRYPGINKWMIGRGILRDPSLMTKIRPLATPARFQEASVADFYLGLSKLYKKIDLSDHIILTRIKTLALYLGMGQDFPKQTTKKIRKASSLEVMLEHLPPYASGDPQSHLLSQAGQPSHAFA